MTEPNRDIDIQVQSHHLLPPLEIQEVPADCF